jgi:hypothetical protein
MATRKKRRKLMEEHLMALVRKIVSLRKRAEPLNVPHGQKKEIVVKS